MYDINNIVSSMFGIEMTLAFSNLSHKKEIQLRKKQLSPLQQLFWKPQPFRESIFAKFFFQATLLQLSLNLQHKFSFCHNRVVLVTFLITFYNFW